MHSFLGAQVATHGRVTFGIHMGLEPCYIAVTVDDLKKVTKMVICGAAMIKKKTMWIPVGAGTHTGHTGHTGARGQTDHTDEPHSLYR